MNIKMPNDQNNSGLTTEKGSISAAERALNGTSMLKLAKPSGCCYEPWTLRRRRKLCEEIPSGDAEDIRAFEIRPHARSSAPKVPESVGITDEEMAVLAGEFANRWSRPRDVSCYRYALLDVCSYYKEWVRLQPPSLQAKC